MTVGGTAPVKLQGNILFACLSLKSNVNDIVGFKYCWVTIDWDKKVEEPRRSVPIAEFS